MTSRLTTVAAALCLTSATVALLPAPSSAATGPDRETVAEGGHTARISRTEYGIPHILARDFDGLGYGYGYAFAQDNACGLADQVVTLRGERSRFFGPDGEQGKGSNLASDTYYKGQLRAGTVQQLLNRKAPLGPTAELRRMVEGYAAGYNRYLRDTGVGKLPDPRCKGKPWARPITPLDLWSVVYDVNGVTGVTPLAPDIGNAKPPTPGVDDPMTSGTSNGKSTTATKATAAASVAPSRPGPKAAGVGSNGWALGRDATRSGNAMVLANPHLPWTRGNLRFYQVQLTIPGTLNVSGAGLYGTPLIQIGHNRNLAWTHTASDAQHASLYALKLVPGDPTSYVFDGKAEQMRRQTVPVTVRDSHGKLSSVNRTLYTSRFGPVLSSNWTAKTAYTIRDANADNLRSMNTWLAMGKAQNLSQLRAAQDTYQGIPWTYTLAADTSGGTYFTDSSVVPHLTDEQLRRCASPDGEERSAALDGSTSACVWGSDSDALVPGVYGPSNQPKLSREDYVANSNNGPHYTNPEAPLTGFPGTYDSDPRLGQRAQLGLRMIDQRADGTDGLGAPGFTGATLRASMLGNRVLSAETGRDDVVGMCRAHPRMTTTDGKEVDVRQACTILARWDTRADTGSRGAALWAAFLDRLLRSGGPDTWHRVPYDPAEPLTTPRGIKGDDARVQRALADTVQDFAARGLPADTRLGAVQKWAGIPLPGCTGRRGCFNIVDAGPGSGSGTPPAGAFGTSFLMAVELTPSGPRAHTLLTYGQSANPASPHYSDQTRLFTRKRWVTERFTAAEIASDPTLRVTTLHR
ncbi:penicillin acylase family protein [Streptomyces albipurpureus]|uniref:Penicillin acylase family protein n=1 Tax=Streptomyces albipurpureus TaxID=2897419 RepID=A0ABT0UNI4_9ACTN|nr:penicillin acylase family protein [Streptomyces sp. CWNU-1]MCM2390015.1 penicillin acylase family protein [Streptomyces sp. CWNU-1]